MKYQKFTFYESFFEAIEEVPKKQQGECYRAIVRYALTGEEPTDIKGLAKIIFLQAKPQIDANHRRAENGAKGAEFGAQGAEFGKLGGRPKTPQKPANNPPKNPPKNPRNINNLNTNNTNTNTNTNIEVVEEKNIIKKERTPDFDFRGALIEYGTSTPLADEWIRIRSAKNNINTKIAFDYILSEANKIGITIPEVVEFCVSKQYIRFEASWYVNAMREQRNNRGGGFMSDAEAQAICDAGLKLHEFIGRNRQ